MQYKILAVDDNPINLKLLSRALIHSNYQLMTTTSGAEALQLAEREWPDLILLDVILPEMDGYEVCKKLQENEATALIPVIFLSAKNESVDKARGLGLGAIDYLTKPFDPVEINARVRTHLQAHHAKIKLMRKNAELQNQIAAAARNQNTSDDSSLITFIDERNSYRFEHQTDRYEAAAFAGSDAAPVVSRLIPIIKEDDRLMFMIVRGHEKNYSTALMLLLIEQYLNGYAAGNAHKAWRPQTLSAFVHDFMEAFSPDIYGVIFTFALYCFDFRRGRLYLYRLQHKPPYVFGPQGAADGFFRGRALRVRSPYHSIVKAASGHVRPGRIVAYYAPDDKAEAESVDYEKVRSTLVNGGDRIQKAVQKIGERPGPGDASPLFFALKVRR